MVVCATPQSFDNDRLGVRVIIIPSDPHSSLSSLEVCYELQHCVLRSCCGWMAHQYVEILALNHLAYHPMRHLVLKESMLPTELAAKYFSELLKLDFGGKSVSPRAILVEDLDDRVWWVHPFWDWHILSFRCLLGVW